MFLDTGIEQVAGHLSREGRWGWDGACLETVSAIAHDPIGYKGGVNLYEYVGDSALTRTDPNGLWFMTVYDNGNGQVCGYSVWLLTGSWCADPDVAIAATDAHDQYTTCWWDQPV